MTPARPGVESGSAGDFPVESGRQVVSYGTRAWGANGGHACGPVMSGVR